MLADEGSVVGIDVGFSTKRKSSAICRLDWNKASIYLSSTRFRATEEERSEAISRIIGSHAIGAVALDGPFRGALDEIGVYRVAESMLTRRLQPLIGKPGQSNSPTGRMLNLATNDCAHAVLRFGKDLLAKSTHTKALHEKSLWEAFPTAFLGVLIQTPKALAVKRGNRSDLFFVHAVQVGAIKRLLEFLLPERKIQTRLEEIINHDDRAAFVCALTALCTVAGKFTAVGDENGWIILPPNEMIQDWAMELLVMNAGSGSTLHIAP